MKKVLSLILSIVLLISVMPLSGLTVNAATSGTCGDNLTWSFDETTGKLTITGSGAMWDDDYSDGAPWYACRSSILSVELSNGITSIRSHAFFDCSSLTSITIPDTVTSIGSNAFENTAFYTNIDNWENEALYIGNHLIEINESISGEYEIKKGTITIADSAFSNCSSLASITIPDSVTSIGDYTFSGCSSLTSVTIGDSVTSIGDYAFSGCSSFTSITIPDSVTSIGEGAFYGCSSLTSIAIPDSVMHIDSNVFLYSGYYADENNWENDVLYIGNHLIAVNRRISGTYKIKTGTKVIAESAFFNCIYLTSITIPDSVIIGDLAFYFCVRLSSITISDSVTIGSFAFDNTEYYNNKSNWVNKTLYIGNHLICSDDNIAQYEVREGTATIASMAFDYQEDMIDIIIPKTVRIIGEGAFFYCSSLTSITIPDSVTSIGSHTFYNCSSLTSVTIPDSVTSIGEDAFSGCESLNDVYYFGSNTDWKKITPEEGNESLIYANIHYNTPNLKNSEFNDILVEKLSNGVVYEEVCDANGNGKSDIADKLRMKKLLANSEQNEVSDFNGDGVTDETDYSFVTAFLLNYNPEFE